MTIALENDSPFVKLNYDLTATGNYQVRYLRGPWLKVGESSFGTAKDDAILPGVDWGRRRRMDERNGLFQGPVGIAGGSPPQQGFRTGHGDQP